MKRNPDADRRALYLLTAERAVILAGGGVGRETVIYHEMPRVAAAPVCPDVRFNLMVGVGLGFLLSPAIVVVVMRKKTLPVETDPSRAA